MPLIRFAVISPSKKISKRFFETVTVPSFSEGIGKEIRRGCRSFLISPLVEDKAVSKIAQAIADLKIAEPEIDFHFIGSAIRTKGCLP